MAKTQKVRAVDEPNLVLPLATSYNERGVAGYTHSITNSEDQRKINCFYEISRNAATGKGTLVLSKRPGVALSSDARHFGGTTQDVYLIIIAPITSSSASKQAQVFSWMAAVTGGNIIVSDGTTNKIIEAFGTRFPAYMDKTIISGTETVVLQDAPFAASSAQNVWYSTVIGTWTQITDADFTALVHRGKMEFMDGYAFILASDNKIYNSDNNSLANWTATSFLAKQIVQDIPAGLMRLKNQIIGMGQDTAEVFYNAGNTTGSPLVPIKQLHQRVGLILPTNNGGAPSGSAHYYCTIGTKIYFVGRISGGKNSAGLFSYDGQNFDKVSSPYADKILSEVVPNTYYSLNSMGFIGTQHVAILLTSPNATSQRWLMYAPAFNEWFEWTSSVFSPINNSEHYLSCGTNLKDLTYNFTASDNWQDDGTSYAWSTQFRLPTNGSSLNFLGMYGVDADTDASGTANTITVEISTDDCVSFSTLGTLDQAQDRKVNIGGGSFRKAHIRLGNTNSRPTRIHNFLAGLD